jgi:hypothetical protein
MLYFRKSLGPCVRRPSQRVFVDAASRDDRNVGSMDPRLREDDSEKV